MTDEMRELLHASIQWRHARTLADEFKRGTDRDTPMNPQILQMVLGANKRLMAASFKAERVHGPNSGINRSREAASG